MLERRRIPTAGVFEEARFVLAGHATADGAGDDARDQGARLLPPRGTELSRGSETDALPQSADEVGPTDVAPPSPIHRAARMFRGHPAIGYVFAFAVIGVATALQWLCRDLYQGTPFLTIYPAVVLATFIGGYRAGLLAAVLAGLSQWYLFIPEYHWLGVLSYAVDAGVCVALIEYINRSLEKETAAKEHQTLLKNELHHRMQNLSTIIQSVVRFSLPNTDAPVSPAVIRERLFGRLQAMFDANQYVGDAKGEVALVDLIRGQIRGLDGQFRIHGRPHVMLDPQLTQNFSLVLYELVTNSLKYGALSTADGRVHIKLLETPGGVAFDWTEFHGPAVSAPPDDGSGDGFGSRILGPFARSFCSDVNFAYEAHGFRYGLHILRQRD
jgi:two-component sensor histidine kinase